VQSKSLLNILGMFGWNADKFCNQQSEKLSPECENRRLILERFPNILSFNGGMQVHNIHSRKKSFWKKRVLHSLNSNFDMGQNIVMEITSEPKEIQCLLICNKIWSRTNAVLFN